MYLEQIIHNKQNECSVRTEHAKTVHDDMLLGWFLDGFGASVGTECANMEQLQNSIPGF